jgi:branched-chain amino acid transport system substrate-binding protein
MKEVSKMPEPSYFKILPVLILIGLTNIGCMKGEEPIANVIKIGTAGPMTGDQSAFGQDQQNGVALAVEEWNLKGGVLGKKIELVVGDDQHDPKQAVSVANKMVNDGVAGMVGHFNSSCSIPASKIYNEQKIPMITHGSTNPQLTEQNFKGIFRICGGMTSKARRRRVYHNDLKAKNCGHIMIRPPTARVG